MYYGETLDTESQVTVSVDGVQYTLPPGAEVTLKTGESIPMARHEIFLLISAVFACN